MRIQLRHGTAAQWSTDNPTLAAGEIGVATDTGQVKIGDGATAWTGLSSASADVSNLLASGEETAPREGNTANAGIQLSSGTLRLVYFTARKTETITQLALFSGNTAAGATPTLCRAGVFAVAANGDLTLVASIANDTSIFAATNTRYTRNLTASWSKIAGQRYASGLLVVTAAAAPTILGSFVGSSASTGIGTSAPRLVGGLSGQADLPASIPAGTINPDVNMPYVEMLP